MVKAKVKVNVKVTVTVRVKRHLGEKLENFLLPREWVLLRLQGNNGFFCLDLPEFRYNGQSRWALIRH